jgi:uncharacterized membrane protein
MSFFLFLVIAIAFFYLNSRISTLESLVRSNYNTKTPPVPQAPQVQQAQVSEAPAAPVVEAAPTPVATKEESSGRWLGKIGITAVSFGVLFFLQYAYEQGWVSEIGLVLIGVFAGISLAGLGAYLRTKYERYGNLLIGGGFSLLFISDYVASVAYELIPNSVALIVALIITGAAVAVSLYYNSVVLMGAGLIGAIISVLVLGMSKDLIAFTFTYMTILAIGSLVIASFKKWPVINYITFVSTYLVYFVMFVSWFKKGENTTVFAFFLTIFFLVYLISSVLHHFVRGEESNSADLTLVTTNALGSFFLYFLLLDAITKEVVAYIALGYGIIYILLAYLANVYFEKKEGLKNTFVGLGALFLTFFVPLQWDGRAVTVAWALLALGFFVGTLKIKVPALRFFGPLALTFSLIRFFLIDEMNGAVFFNVSVAVGILTIVVAYIASWISSKWTYEHPEEKRQIAAVFFVLAHFLTMFIGTREIYRHYNVQIQNVMTAELYNGPSVSDVENQRNAVVSVVWTLYAVLLLVIGFGFGLSQFRSVGLAIFFITAIKVFFDVWGLGQLYRIISSIVYGVVALVGSFLYSKYYSHKPTHHS